MELLAALGVNLVASLIFVLAGLFFFNRPLLLARIKLILRLRERRFTPLRSRRQVRSLFKEAFIDDGANGGKVLLLSNTGGSPQFNPFPRIREVAADRGTEVVVGLSRAAYVSAYSSDPELIRSLLKSTNVRLVAFDDLTAYHNRMAVNTSKALAFYCAYSGHNDEKADYEGFFTRDKDSVQLMARLFYSLIDGGSRLALADFAKPKAVPKLSAR